MPIFTVHVPRTFADPADRADRTFFVRDGFNGWAFVFGPLFLLRHRAWLAAAIWFVLVIADFGLGSLLHVALGAELAIVLLIALFLGFEGNSLRRLALARRRYDLVDVVVGPGRQDVELAFFHAHGGDRGGDSAAPRPGPKTIAVQRRAEPHSGPEPVIGLFPSQGG